MLVPRNRIDSTAKWVEYSLDIVDMQKLLMKTKLLNEKYQLMDSLEVAERKKKWHYRQENFNLQKAGRFLQAMLQAHKMI